uniref:Tumor necrosis factor receptor superfamily member 12A n=2 Tax=Capra hircus TaxID=9925 RepID=A0A8C2QZ07_CAPHI
MGCLVSDPLPRPTHTSRASATEKARPHLPPFGMLAAPAQRRRLLSECLNLAGGSGRDWASRGGSWGPGQDEGSAPEGGGGGGAATVCPGPPVASADGSGCQTSTMAHCPLRPLLRLLVLGLGLALLRAAAGERVPGTTPCSRGTSWSADLDKCMDCASCRARPHSDFCLGCTAAPPAPFRLLWPILGGALGLALLLGLLSGFLVWRRCRRREKFTTPIEETGGESCPGVALIQ